jgi:hypothetical protein
MVACWQCADVLASVACWQCASIDPSLYIYSPYLNLAESPSSIPTDKRMTIGKSKQIR